MYNYGNLGRGIDRTFPENSSGSGSSSATTAQKYSVAGSSQFVPSLNAITSNQDLQWMLQPSVLGTPGPSRALRPTYSLPPRIPSMNPQHSQSHMSRPGVIRAATAVDSSTRSRNDEHETDELEDEKSRLQKEIAELQKQKEKLELVFQAHRPICKVQDSDSDSDSNSDLPTAPLESESLHTPVLISTPSLTPFTASLVFSYPSSSQDTSSPCGVAHRRSSSSGDQSDHSLNSPTILTL
uniref:FOS-like antigen 1a n=1 Tax=Cyprinus carpio TaxID=7962 RepID=A0A8C2ET28_CYPCA